MIAVIAGQCRFCRRLASMMIGGDTPPSSRGFRGPMKYLAIIAAIVVAIALSQFLFEFYQWNREQSCATAGRHGCAAAHIEFNR